MRVLIVSEWYPSPEAPTSGIFVQDQARAVSALHEVSVLYHEARPSRLRRLESSAQVESGLDVMRVRTPAQWPSRARRIAFAAFAHRMLRKFEERSVAPDVLHAHEFSAGIIARLAGRGRYPLLISEHYTGFIEGRVSGWDAFLAKAIFRRADLVCPVSTRLAETLAAFEPRGRYEVVPNVVDVEAFEAAGQRRVAASSGLRLLTVARLHRQKGLEYLLRALSLPGEQLGNIRLDVVGDGPDRPALENLTTELGLANRVNFHGDLARSAVAGFMEQANIFVLPTLVETFGVVLVEAVAAGLPVVTTTAVPNHERFSDFGRVVAPADSDALADAIQRIDRDRWTPKQSDVKAFIDQFRAPTIAERWSKLYAHSASSLDRRAGVSL